MSRFAQILFLIIFAELSIGGGGRLLAAGPITLRMLLFGIAMLAAAYYYVRHRVLSDDTRQVLIFFTITIGIGIMMGAVNQAEQKFWWEDVKPLLYFLILPFFEWAVSDAKTIQQGISIVKISALIQSVAFVIVLILIHSGTIPFLDFYYFVLPTQEFFFRGEITFFYKGFLFICIAFIVIYLNGMPYRKMFLAVLLVVVCLTLTRGFLLAICLTLLVFHFRNSNRMRAIMFGAIAVAILLFSQPLISYVSTLVYKITAKQGGKPNEKLFGDRSYSDAGRIIQIREVFATVTPTSFFAGHGFGIGVPSRPVHMEISYLEIFHKQGVVGLAFWGFLFWRLRQRYLAASSGILADVLFFSAIFVYFQSMTNQYMNNPIGLSVILFSFVGLRVLKE
jgi:hypothetical protein